MVCSGVCLCEWCVVAYSGGCMCGWVFACVCVCLCGFVHVKRFEYLSCGGTNSTFLRILVDVFEDDEL